MPIYLKGVVCVSVYLAMAEVMAFSAPPPTYSVLEIGKNTFPDANSITYTVINNLNDIAGIAVYDDRWDEGFLWMDTNNDRIEDPDEITLLPSKIDNMGILVNAINNRREILLSVYFDFDAMTAAKWRDGVLIQYPCKRRPVLGFFDMNDYGEAVGAENFTGYGSIPNYLLWREDGCFSLAQYTPKINNSWQYAIYISVEGIEYPAIWTDANDNKTVDPGETIPVLEFPGGNTIADLNEAGVLLGVNFWFQDKNQNGQSDPGEAVELPIESDILEMCRAEAMNVHNQIIGSGDRKGTGGAVHAVIWNDFELYDLNDFVPDEYIGRLEYGRAINDNGWILCTSFNAFQSFTFLLIPETSNVAEWCLER